MTDDAPQLRNTALVERHRELGARLIDFAGWLMPVSYSGILEEHKAVRERVGSGADGARIAAAVKAGLT